MAVSDVGKEPIVETITIAISVGLNVEIITTIALVGVGGVVEVSRSSPYRKGSVSPPIEIIVSNIIPSESTDEIPGIFDVTFILTPSVPGIFLSTINVTNDCIS